MTFDDDTNRRNYTDRFKRYSTSLFIRVRNIQGVPFIIQQMSTYYFQTLNRAIELKF